MYCLEDGAALVQGSVPSPDEPQTAILHETGAPNEPATIGQIHTTAAGDAQRRFPTKLVAIIAAGVLIVAGAFFSLRYFRADAKQINSIAVMPFVNESGNADLDYLSDGMTDSLISSLSQVPNLSVKAHTSVFRYKGKDDAPAKIARDLGVQALVNGRVTDHGDKLTVTVDLVDPATENVLWTQRYDRRSSAVVDLQSEIAGDVSSKLRARLSGEDHARVTKSYTADPEAYELYLKGRFLWNKRGKDGLLQAADFFNRAIQKDPNYALAYAGLAETYTLFPDYSLAKPEDSYPRSRTAALRALELDDTLAEAHTALGRYYNYWEWDRAGAEKEYRQAIALRPNYATAHHWLGSDVLTQEGRFDEAIAECQKAKDLDPLSPIIADNFGDTLYYARRYDEALATYRMAIELDPDFYFSYTAQGYALAASGKYQDGVASLRRGLQVSSDPLVKGYLAYAFGRSGDKQQALMLISQMRQDAASGYVPAYAFAIAYGAIGDNDEAFKWLNKEVDDHGTGGAMVGVDPLLDTVRGDPRFKAILERVHL